MIDEVLILKVCILGGLMEGTGMNIVLLFSGYPGVPVFTPECCWSRDLSGFGSWRGFLRLSILRNPKDHFHIMRGTPASDPSMNILGIGGRDEVVIPAWPELQPSWGGGEAPERNGEVHKGLRLITHSNYPRSRTRDTT